MLKAKHVKPLSLVIMLLVLSLVFFSPPTYATQSASPGNSPNKGGAIVDPEIIEAISLGWDPIPVIVVFTVDPEAGCAAVKATSPRTVVEKVYTIIPAALMKIPSTDVLKISRLPEVRSMWLDRQVRLESLEAYGNGWAGLNADLDVGQIWAEGFNGSGVVVAILDSGIDSSHPDLDDLDDDPSTNDPKVIASVSMVDYDPFPYDFNGHGTYVAGIVAGTGNASGGTYKGVAPGALLMNVKVFDVEGLSLYSWILSGVEWSVSHGADIILVAFSVPGLPDDPLCLAVDAAARMGVMVVAAAGDGGPAYISIGSPGSALGAITVGAYNSSGKTCSFSGRGPSLYMWTKPDVVAPGYNVVSCRARPPDLGFNISIPQFNLSGYGTPVDENYTSASTTAAAAAYVAGLSALLLQSSMYASPESVKITLLKNAIDLGESPNIQGAGLVNPYASYSYLKSKGGTPLNVSGRTYTISLPPAPLMVNGTDLLSYCLVGSCGTITAMSLSNATSNFNSSHLLQGMFGVSYNGGDTIWLTTGTILRELHISHVNETTGYEKLVSILQLDCLLVVIVFECWSNYNASHAINAFKVTMSFINVGGEAVSNLHLIFFWSPSLFLDETDPSSDDHGLFNATLETIEVNDTCDSNEGQVLWLAFKGSMNVAGYDVGEKNSVFSNASKGVFSNNSEYTGNLGLAASWLLSPRLEPNGSSSFTAALSFGGSQADAQNAVLEAIEAQEQLYVADLCIVNASITRLHQLGADYASECMVLNVGNIAANASVFFFANRSGDGGTVYYAEEFRIENLQPCMPVKLKAVWRPTSGGIYSAGWATWEPLTLPLEYLLNPELLANITELLQQFNITELYLLDNYMARNIFIGSPPPDQVVFPARIPCNPFPVSFPIDFAYYNLTVITTGILSDIKVSVEGGASKLTFISKVPESIDRFGTVEASINTTTPSTLSLDIPLNLPFELFNLPNPGNYDGTIKVTLGGSECRVSVSFTITYPQGRILFDSAHNLIDVEHIEESLDSTFTGYFSLYEVARASMHELDEIPLLQEINGTILRMYDVLVVCDPELPFSQAELDALELFVRSGGCLLVMVEPDNFTLINEILEPYGIRALSSVAENLTLTAENFTSHPITGGLSSITLYSPVLFEVDESKGAFALTKDQVFAAGARYGMGRVIVFGDSDFASLFHVEEGDNAQLVSNALEWLMENRLNLELVMSTPREGGKVYLGDRVYFLIHVTSAEGGDVHENLTIFAVFNLPNGTSVPMWCFHYKDGYYTTLLFTELTEQTGNYTLIIWADSPSHTSTFATLTFTVLSSPPESPPAFYYPSPTQDILLGFLATSSILALVAGTYFVRRRRFQRKAFIPELDQELAYYMRTVINEVKAAFKELEIMLSDESLDDFEKIRIIHESLPRLKRTLTKLKTLAEIIGE